MVDLVNETVGNYRIDALIGAGGMAQVYRAVHVELNRIVAIKVMWPNLAADPTFRERFLREARTASALSHPHIVAIHDFGRRESDGLLYLVMEMMAQGSLRDVFERRLAGTQPLELVSGLDLVRQAADGLAYAHAQRMVHGDIKPDNLLLNPMTVRSKIGCPYTLKVADFGLAKVAEAGVTLSGITAGAAAYMSPEQCEGTPLDTRTDLYSLGIVLYEIATGYPPFQIKTIADAIYKHINVAPVPPLQVNPDLPPRLQEIILRCLAKHPNDRYATAEELSADLAAIIQEIVSPAPIPDVAPQTAAVSADPGRIYVALSAGEKLQLTPGVPAAVKILIVNLRTIVDHFHVTVEGVPAEWVTGNERALQLNPNGHDEMTLTITAPRAPASAAKEYPVTIHVQSRANTTDTGAVADRWAVLPYYGGTVALESDRESGIGKARFGVILRNTGNTTVGYRLTAEDAESVELTYRFAREQVQLAPGTDEHIRLDVSAPPREGGDTRRHTFRVVATPDAGDAPPPATGTWFEQALPPKPPPVVASPPHPTPAAAETAPLPTDRGGDRPFDDAARPTTALRPPPPERPVWTPAATRAYAPPPVPNVLPPGQWPYAAQPIRPAPVAIDRADRGEAKHEGRRRASLNLLAVVLALLQIVFAFLFYRAAMYWSLLLGFSLFHVLVAIGALLRNRLLAVVYLLYSIAFLAASAFLLFSTYDRGKFNDTFFFDRHLRLFHGVFVGAANKFTKISYPQFATFLAFLVGANIFMLLNLRRARR